VIEEPENGRVLVLPPLGTKTEPPANATPEERFQLELTWNKATRRKLVANWKGALRDANLSVPESGTLKIVEVSPGERVIVLPRIELVPEPFVHDDCHRFAEGTSRYEIEPAFFQPSRNNHVFGWYTTSGS
jgi:hypothetical protein